MCFALRDFCSVVPLLAADERDEAKGVFFPVVTFRL